MAEVVGNATVAPTTAKTVFENQIALKQNKLQFKVRLTKHRSPFMMLSQE